MFKIAFVDSLDEIPEWIADKDREELSEWNFERMQDEGRSVLVVKVGDKGHIKRDGGEPEDNTFGRDWHWVDGLLSAVYSEGVKDGVALCEAGAHAPGDGQA